LINAWEDSSEINLKIFWLRHPYLLLKRSWKYLTYYQCGTESPQDRESVFWINVAIPRLISQHWPIRMLYSLRFYLHRFIRPTGLTTKAEDSLNTLKFSKTADGISGIHLLLCVFCQSLFRWQKVNVMAPPLTQTKSQTALAVTWANSQWLWWFNV
jgi:fimbrial chaperone protein